MSTRNLTRRAAMIAAATLPAVPALAAAPADVVAPFVADLKRAEGERSGLYDLIADQEAESGYFEICRKRHLFELVHVRGVRADWDIGASEIDAREASGDITPEAAADARQRLAAKVQEIADTREAYGLKPFDDRLEELKEHIDKLYTAIIETEARTVADLRAKAEIVADLQGISANYAEEGDLTAEVIMSLLEDLQRTAGGAA